MRVYDPGVEASENAGIFGLSDKTPQLCALRLENLGMGWKRRDQRITPGQPNHLITRGNNRRRIFSYPHERLTFLRILADKLERTASLLHAVCLMTNHIHMITTPPSVEAASALMRLTLQRYAQVRNGARNGSGKLFEGPFHSEPIESTAQLATTQMYIEANPLRAGLLEDPARYPWSSYGIFAGEDANTKIPADLLTPSPWYRDLATTATERAAFYREAFAAYLASRAAPEHVASIESYEAASEPHGRRVRRPDGSDAR